jgi:hypothetical protein
MGDLVCEGAYGAEIACPVELASADVYVESEAYVHKKHKHGKWNEEREVTQGELTTNAQLAKALNGH